MTKTQKTLILHIGRHKTGTSSIQDVLALNRKELMRNRLYYPKGYINNHTINFTPLFFLDHSDNFFFKQTYGIQSKQQAEQRYRSLSRFWINEFKAFNRSSCTHFVISAEQFSFADQAVLKRLKAFVSPYFDRINVVGYYRPAVDYLRSSAQEAIKFGTLSFNNISKYFDSHLEFSKTLKAFISVFGEENVTIRPFISTYLKSGDVVIDFLDTTGFKDNLINQSALSPSNTSIGKYSLNFLSAFNQRSHNQGERYMYIQPSLVNILSRIDEPKNDMPVQLTNAQITRINKEYELINKYISSDYHFEPLKAGDDAKMPDIMGIPSEYYMDLFESYNVELVELKKTLAEMRKHPLRVLFFNRLMRKLGLKK